MDYTRDIMPIERRLADAEARLAKAEVLLNELLSKLQAEPALHIQYQPHREMDTLPRTTSP